MNGDFYKRIGGVDNGDWWKCSGCGCQNIFSQTHLLYFEGQIEKQKKAFYSTTMLQTINTQETIHIDYTLDNVLMG